LKIRWNIRRKLNAVLTLCGLVFIAICAPIISYLSFEDYQQSAQAQQGRLVGALSTSAAISIFVANEEIAEEVLDGLLQDDEILAAEIVGNDGFSKRARSKISKPFELNAETIQHYPLSSPIEQTEVIGEIKVWPNQSLISERATNIVYQNIIWLIVLTLLIAIASMFATNILVATPLRRLADQVALAKPGEQGIIKVGKLNARDEIGLVTDSMNGFLSVTRGAIEKERELRVQIEHMNKHFSNIFASSHVGIMVVDQRGRLLHHNPVLLERIIKLNESQYQALPHQDIFSIAFADTTDVWGLVELARTSNETVERDLPLAAAWQQPCWVHCILTVNRDKDSDEEVIECVLYDVTRRVLEAEEALQLAELDSLTGLHNRRGCERYLQQWLTEPDEEHLVIMVLDLDNFKPVNDQYGHVAGDQVLQTIATRLQGEVRANIDLVGRVGGDEFVVFLKMKSNRRDLVEQVAEKIIHRIAEPIVLISNQSVEIGVSIGIAFASNFETLDDVMQAADEAMYQVKIKGKNDFIFAD